MALLTDSCDIASFTEGSAVVAVDTGVVHIEQSSTGDAFEVFRVPGLTQGLDGVLGGDHRSLLRFTDTGERDTYIEYEATAGSTARDEHLLVIHLTVQQPVLLEHLAVPQPQPALGAGEVRLMPVGVTSLR